jgi:hypothetical protein
MSGGGTVSYEIAPRGVSRVARFTDQPEHHEQFRFPETATFHFERLAGPDRVRLVIVSPRNPATSPSRSQQADSGAAPNRAIPIEAVVSRDHRFAPTEP